MKTIWKFVKADQFFPAYCPQIKSYKHKMRGLNGRGNPTDFTEAERKQIAAGIKKLAAELKKCNIVSKIDLK